MSRSYDCCRQYQVLAHLSCSLIVIRDPVTPDLRSEQRTDDKTSCLVFVHLSKVMPQSWIRLETPILFSTVYIV